MPKGDSYFNEDIRKFERFTLTHPWKIYKLTSIQYNDSIYYEVIPEEIDRICNRRIRI